MATQASTLSGRALGLGGPSQVLSGKPRMPVTARRTVSQRYLNRAKPNWELDEPDRLWEIGSSFWLPFNGYTPPDYLDGSLPGDRGFDPFRLGASWGNPPDGSESPERRLGWLLEGELYNGRLAMLAVVGILTTEYLGKGNYWEIPFNLGVTATTFATGVVGIHLLMAFLEKKRIENWTERGEAGHFGLAPFDPLDLTNDYIRQAEVRNARLAMLSALGFAAQSYVTGKGPIQNAVDHASAPFENNIFTYGDRGIQVVVAFLAFAVVLHLVELSRKAEPSLKRRTAGGAA